MNRTLINHRLLSLALWLLVAICVRAQSVEYWFDDKVDPKPLSLSGGQATVSARGLKAGLHTIHLRASNGGGYDDYSPVYSSTFLKFEAPGAARIQYWFDGDVKHLASMPIDTDAETVQMIDLDLSNSEKFPIGIHQLNMRIVAASGQYSPVYNALVMRMPAGAENSVLEYWFDEDNTKSGTIPVSLKTDGVQTLNLDMSSLDYFPYGLHKLNMRVAAYGNQYSPVYSAFVMRLPTGPNNYIAYWLDDDYDPKNLKKARAYSQNGLDATFVADLNLSSASSGMHRLHFRVSRNAVDYGTTYEVPILVTRKYVKSEGESVVIIKQLWGVDDVMHGPYDVKNPRVTYILQYVLTPEKYSVGQHAFHVQFQNSAEVWSEENVTYFYKDAAMSRLHEGFMPDDETTGIEDLSQSEVVACECENGTIYVDCLSPKLGKAGVITVYDMMGRVVAQQKVTNDNGIHVALSVENFARQILIVKLVCGDMRFSRKIINR